MKKNRAIVTLSTVAVLLLSSCTAENQNSSPEKSEKEPFTILATVEAPEAALAFIEKNPINYLAPKYDKVVVGAVQGQITNVQYTTFGLAGGVDETYELELAVNIMTVSVSGSTFQVQKEIKVATTGGYLSPDVPDVYGKPSEDLGREGVIEYESLGGAKPPVVGETVVLYLQKSLGGFQKLAPYSVIGASFGRLTLDSESGKFNRKIDTDDQADNFSKKELTGNLLKTK